MASKKHNSLDSYMRLMEEIERQKKFYGFWDSLILLFKGHRFEKSLSPSTLKSYIESSNRKEEGSKKC
jgi:hypothetical protein